MQNILEAQTEINLLDPKELMQFARGTSETGRRRLADAVSQFFDGRELSDTELKLASDMMMSLLRQAELDIREALAERLSVQDNIPPEIIVFLANDAISVARPVLLHSTVLKDIDLMFIIASKSEEYWRSIAVRAELSPMVADRLIDTKDTGTVLNLIGNQRVTLQKMSIKKIIRVAMKTEKLQLPLLRRPEIDGDQAVNLYMCVSHELQNEITERFRLPPSVIESSLEALVFELSLEAKGSQQVTPEMAMIARRFKERDGITTDLMVKTLRRGQVSFFIALFGEKNGLMPNAVVRLIQKEGGTGLALACRSIGMMKPEFASIFLLSRGIGGGKKIVDQREFATVLKHYDAIKEFDIQRIMRSWVKNPDLI